MGAVNSSEIDISDGDLQQLALSNDDVNLSKVVKLYARRNRINKIPMEVKLMTQLTEVSLRDNALDEFPEALCEIKTLVKLSLSYNQIKSIPGSIKNLENLQLFSIAGNLLTELNAHIGNLKSLQALDVQKNRLQCLPNGIRNLKRLETLLIQKNSLTSLQGDIDGCKSLRVLNCGFNRLQYLPHNLSNLPKLEELVCSSNSLAMFPPTFFTGPAAKHLVNLDMHTNKFKSIPDDIGKAVKLKRLNLAINQLTELPNTIGSLVELEWLNVNDNKLKTLPTSINSLVNLKKLGLVQNEIVTLPNEIAGLKSISKIDLRRNKVSAFPPTIRYMQSLTHLLIDDNPLITARGEVMVIPEKFGHATKEHEPNRISSLTELASRHLWKMRWQDHLQSSVHFNPLLIPGSPTSATEESNSTTARNSVIQQQPGMEGKDLGFDAILKTFETLNLSKVKKMVIPEFIRKTELPDRLQRYLATPSICNLCLGPFCDEAIEFIEHSPLQNIPDQHVPVRFWMCSRTCINIFTGIIEKPINSEANISGNAQATEDESSASVSSSSPLRWLFGRVEESTRARSWSRGGYTYYSYVVNGDGATGSRTSNLQIAGENMIPRGWLANRIRQAGNAAAGSEVNRVSLTALDRRQLETF